jgi:hypothetical protein
MRLTWAVRSLTSRLRSRCVRFGVFLLRGRHPDHAEDEAVASVVGNQDPQEPANVEAVGLGAQRPPVHQDARRVDTMLSIPASVSARWIQNPSRPAS